MKVLLKNSFKRNKANFDLVKKYEVVQSNHLKRMNWILRIDKTRKEFPWNLIIICNINESERLCKTLIGIQFTAEKVSIA
ncbi:CLUMA_CG011755, isoform A [Clunio marinus]|uniref:CLUMA_CG011755, isoform A n=1 Tax=Clunio marinus TaxID=568069 RepID=A0A1J1IFT5_9DIPT|nr:CLUMA_CG011755, isoform A [Clunio marinus]